jgi:hypothetical protein
MPESVGPARLLLEQALTRVGLGEHDAMQAAVSPRPLLMSAGVPGP